MFKTKVGYRKLPKEISFSRRNLTQALCSTDHLYSPVFYSQAIKRVIGFSIGNFSGAAQSQELSSMVMIIILCRDIMLVVNYIWESMPNAYLFMKLSGWGRPVHCYQTI